MRRSRGSGKMTFDKEGFNVETLADEEKNNLGVSQHNDPIKKLQSTKSLNIRKTELMASCYDRWYLSLIHI